MSFCFNFTKSNNNDIIEKNLLIYKPQLKRKIKMKTLVVFYSRTGNNKKIAELIKEKIGGDIEKIIDLKNRNGLIGWMRSGMDALLKRETKIKDTVSDPDNYDMLIVGNPVWAGSITPALRTYLNRNKDKIKDYALFSVSGFGEKNKKISDVIKSILKKEPKAELFISDKELEKELYANKLNDFIKNIS